MAIKVGEKLPSVSLKYMDKDGIQTVKTDDLFKGKKVVLFALPGAFTPTCSAKHLPSFVAKADELKAKGTRDVVRLGYDESRVRYRVELDLRYGDQLALTTLVDEGDEVLLPDPGFVAYPTIVRMAGGTPVFYRLPAARDFALDIDDFRRKLSPRTRIAVCISPSNPTGRTLGEDDLRAMARALAGTGAIVVSDEIYREFCYDAPFASPTKWNDQSLVIDGFSKTYGVTGWRLGFVHVPSAIVDKLTMLQQYTFVCAPHPLQFAAVAALDGPALGIDRRPVLLRTLQDQPQAAGKVVHFLIRQGESPAIGGHQGHLVVFKAQEDAIQHVTRFVG